VLEGEIQVNEIVIDGGKRTRLKSQRTMAFFLEALWCLEIVSPG